MASYDKYLTAAAPAPAAKSYAKYLTAEPAREEITAEGEAYTGRPEAVAKFKAGGHTPEEAGLSLVADAGVDLHRLMILFFSYPFFNSTSIFPCTFSTSCCVSVRSLAR